MKVGSIGKKMTSNKFHAKPIYCNLTTLETSRDKGINFDAYFASQLEFETYRVLRQFFPQGNIKRQYKVLIKPATKNFSEILWRIDFAVVDNLHNLRLLIESKGFLTDDFKLKLAWLEYRNPGFYHKLILVSSQETDFNKEIHSISLEQLKHRLFNHGLVL